MARTGDIVNIHLNINDNRTFSAFIDDVPCVARTGDIVNKHLKRTIIVNVQMNIDDVPCAARTGDIVNIHLKIFKTDHQNPKNYTQLIIKIIKTQLIIKIKYTFILMIINPIDIIIFPQTRLLWF